MFLGGPLLLFIFEMNKRTAFRQFSYFTFRYCFRLKRVAISERDILLLDIFPQTKGELTVAIQCRVSENKNEYIIWWRDEHLLGSTFKYTFNERTYKRVRLHSTTRVFRKIETLVSSRYRHNQKSTYKSYVWAISTQSSQDDDVRIWSIVMSSPLKFGFFQLHFM